MPNHKKSQKKSKKSKMSQKGGAVGAILGVGNARIGGMAEVLPQGDCPQITAANQYGGKRKNKK